MVSGAWPIRVIQRAWPPPRRGCVRFAAPTGRPRPPILVLVLVLATLVGHDGLMASAAPTTDAVQAHAHASAEGEGSIHSPTDDPAHPDGCWTTLTAVVQRVAADQPTDLPGASIALVPSPSNIAPPRATEGDDPVARAPLRATLQVWRV